MSRSQSRSLSLSPPSSPNFKAEQALQQAAAAAARHRRVSYSRSRSRSRSPIASGAVGGDGSSAAPQRSRRLQSKRVAMLNLPYSINVLQLKKIVKDKLGFAGYVILLEENGRFSGIGYMDFRTYEGAEEAIERLNGMDIDGRRIKVRQEVPSDRDRLERAERARGSGSVGGGGGGGGGSSNRDALSSASYSRGSERDRGSGGGSGTAQALLSQLGIHGPISNSVFISNLDGRVTWQKLKDVFRLAGRVVKADIIGDGRAAAKVAGLVQFETPLEAAQAISMLNNQMLYDRPMRVRMDLPESERPDARNRRASALPEGLGGVGAGLDRATARELQEIIGGSGGDSGRYRSSGPYEYDNGRHSGGGGGGSGGSASDTVFVSNLPYSYDWMSLKSAFRNVGGVHFADIDVGPDRRSLGTGVVQFKSSADARRAVAVMDGAKIEGRSIRVTLR